MQSLPPAQFMQFFSSEDGQIHLLMVDHSLNVLRITLNESLKIHEVANISQLLEEKNNGKSVKKYRKLVNKVQFNDKSQSLFVSFLDLTIFL